MYWLVGLVGCADFANTKLIDNRRSAISVQLLHRADVSQKWLPHPSPECAKNRKTGSSNLAPWCLRATTALPLITISPGD